MFQTQRQIFTYSKLISGYVPEVCLYLPHHEHQRDIGKENWIKSRLLLAIGCNVETFEMLYKRQ